MRTTGFLSTTTYGSVKYMDGEMWASDWTSIYVPLDGPDAQAFLDRVNEKEAQVGRRLNKAELISIVKGMG